MTDTKTSSLTVLGGPLAGTLCELPEDGTVTIGSSPGSSLSLDLLAVSPFHARVVCDAGRVTVHDTGSSRTVHVNDNAIGPEGTELRNGDILWLGAPGSEGVVMIQCRIPPRSSAGSGTRGPVGDDPSVGIEHADVVLQAEKEMPCVDGHGSDRGGFPPFPFDGSVVVQEKQRLGGSEAEASIGGEGEASQRGLGNGRATQGGVAQQRGVDAAQALDVVFEPVDGGGGSRPRVGFSGSVSGQKSGAGSARGQKGARGKRGEGVKRFHESVGETGAGLRPRWLPGSRQPVRSGHWSTCRTGEVPPGFENANQQLDTITSLHWAKGRDVTTVQEAVAYRWLLYSIDWFLDPGWTVAVPHSVQRPGEARTWYAHDNPVGPTAQPSRVARKLPAGSVYEVTSTYNYQDHVTWRRDPVGREVTYTYAGNGIDLLEVGNTTAGRNDLVASYGDFTPGHLPQTATDAAGQVTTTTYTAAGQVLVQTVARHPGPRAD